MKFAPVITRQKPTFTAPLWAREAVKPNHFLKLLRGNFSFRRNIAAFEYERNRKFFRSFNEWRIFAPEQEISKIKCHPTLYKKNYVLYHHNQLETDFFTVKHKNISIRSSELLAYFNEQNKACFDYKEAFAALSDSKKGTILELLSDMTRRGLLMRLKSGVYYIIPYEQDSDSFIPDWHVLAACLVGDAQYYIGYYSALQIHNLITQPSLKEQIVVSRRIRPSEIEIKKVPFQFIYHNEKHFFGKQKIWIDSFNKVYCSDLEKTFIDCLFKPDYAGGIVEIAKAIYASKDKIKWDKLIDYAIKFDSQAVIKRLGLLLETLDIGQQITDDLQKIKSSSYVVLDTELPKIGKRISRWSIQQNLETETIKSAIYY